MVENDYSKMNQIKPEHRRGAMHRREAILCLFNHFPFSIHLQSELAEVRAAVHRNAKSPCGRRVSAGLA